MEHTYVWPCARVGVRFFFVFRGITSCVETKRMAIDVHTIYTRFTHDLHDATGCGSMAGVAMGGERGGER